ncbi:MAG: arylesterase [Acidobacteriota bacterium]
MRDYFKRLFQCLLCLPLLAFAADAHVARVLVMGDSLSAEYGLARGQGWVQIVDEQLRKEASPKLRQHEFINASISGETTAGGRSRLPQLLEQHQPDIVIIELGANDALRGLDVKSTRSNLDAMVKDSLQAKARVLMIGMQVPPNYGKRYTDDFARAFVDVAQANKVPLMPFLLKDVADRPDAKAWFQNDGLHPLAKAHPVIAKNILTALRPLLLGR